jgi:hypothetical protein
MVATHASITIEKHFSALLGPTLRLSEIYWIYLILVDSVCEL